MSALLWVSRIIISFLFNFFSWAPGACFIFLYFFGIETKRANRMKGTVRDTAIRVNAQITSTFPHFLSLTCIFSRLWNFVTCFFVGVGLWGTVRVPQIQTSLDRETLNWCVPAARLDYLYVFGGGVLIFLDLTNDWTTFSWRELD